MEANEACRGGSERLVPLYDRYRALNDLRSHMDQRICGLPLHDEARDIVWQSLELLLAEQRGLIGQLAETPAARLPELQAKAAVLATLLQPDAADGSSTVFDADILALVLSLIDDIARWQGADREAQAASSHAGPTSAPF